MLSKSVHSPMKWKMKLSQNKDKKWVHYVYDHYFYIKITFENV